MPISSAFAVPLLVCLAAGIAPCQTTEAFLSSMDQSSRTFTGAKATIRRTEHIRGIPDDDPEIGTIFVKRSGSKMQFRIDFKPPNEYAAVLREQTVEVYHPKINEITEYNLRAYKNIVEKLFMLGFGMPCRELAANYEIHNLKSDAVDGQACTYMELIPKSPDVRKQLKSIEVWVSAKTLCPARQIFHMPDGSSNTAEFSGMEVNPKLPAGTFDLPKSAKRVKAN